MYIFSLSANNIIDLTKYIETPFNFAAIDFAAFFCEKCTSIFNFEKLKLKSIGGKYDESEKNP